MFASNRQDCHILMSRNNLERKRMGMHEIEILYYSESIEMVKKSLPKGV